MISDNGLIALKNAIHTTGIGASIGSAFGYIIASHNESKKMREIASKYNLKMDRNESIYSATDEDYANYLKDPDIEVVYINNLPVIKLKNSSTAISKATIIGAISFPALAAAVSIINRKRGQGPVYFSDTDINNSLNDFSERLDNINFSIKK